MQTQMAEAGRCLEKQVSAMIQLLAGMQGELAEISGSPAVERAARELSRHRAALAEMTGELQRGQAELEGRLRAQVTELASREAALEASRAQLRALTRRLLQVQEDERRVLARDLHDASGQAMTVIGLGLSMLRRRSDCTESLRARIEELQAAAAAAAEDLRRLSVNLSPFSLDRYGLVPAVEELIAALRRQTGIAVEFVVEGLEERLPADLETALYRIVQEACTNMVRYAAATRASVSLRRTEDAVQVRVQDDGRGFDVAEALSRGRLGLMGMRERAEALGGEFTVESACGHGARLSVDVPVRGFETGDEPAADIQAPTMAPADPGVTSDAATFAHLRMLGEAVVDISDGTSRLDDPLDLLNFVLTRATQTVGCDYALIALVEDGRWIVTHACGLPESMIGQPLVGVAMPLAREIERTRAAVVVNDPLSDDPLAAPAREVGIFSGAGFPLIAAGRFRGGVAFIHNSAPIAFVPTEIYFLQHQSSVMSLVLEIIRLRALENRVGV